GQDCVRQGWIDKPGEMVVCVPSGVFMVMSDDAGPSRAPDAVTY
ncbi:MAG: NusG domain II-containing protein, partial [Candidatus Aegiribacteria sp.]|nr:NusG domain II-containing protein [Candidatus Aegiribacteria sp.]MBD3294635.1 NusG domain II-containing protein [Candidatus Fermentibacteria bacterium]